MHDIYVYEGMCAVCAVLAEVEGRATKGAGLRLAQRHLQLLAQLLAERVPGGTGGPGGPGGPGDTGAGRSGAPAGEAPRAQACLWAAEPQGGSHVWQ